METNTIIRKLEDYSNEELKRLYNSFSLYIVTEWMKYRKRYKNDQNISVLLVSDKPYDTQLDVRFFNSMKCKTIEMKLELKDYKTEEEKQQMINEKTVLKIFNEVLFWFAGGYEALEKDYETGKNVMDPDELYEELHESDDIDREYNKATKYEMYKFIWETLRFCDAKTLGKLCRLSNSKFEFNKPHRPTKNLPIYKYDKEDNLIEIFKNRSECIEKDNISKAALSMVLSGKRTQYKGYKYREKC
jgi:hypothetical protein